MQYFLAFAARLGYLRTQPFGNENESLAKACDVVSCIEMKISVNSKHISFEEISSPNL